MLSQGVSNTVCLCGIALMIALGHNFVMNFVVLGLTLSGTALRQIVVASDCGTPVDELQEHSALLSLNPLPNYLRWYFTSGLATGVYAMSMPCFSLADLFKVYYNFFMYLLSRRKR